MLPDVSSDPPSSDAAPRRRRSRQRDEMLAWLRSTDSHPTASQILEALAPRSPGISLATVYRNLELLVDAGQVREVACERGPHRYDGNAEPHHHFSCDACGRIVDLGLPTPRGLTARLEREHGLRAERVSITFHGRCAACQPRVRVGARARKTTASSTDSRKTNSRKTKGPGGKKKWPT